MATSFPFTLASLTNPKNSSGNMPRYNFINDGTYNVTQNIAMPVGPYVVQGCTAIPGDLGKATIDGGASNIFIISISSNAVLLADLIVQNNASGSGDAIQMSGSGCVIFRCVVNNVRGNGFNVNAAGNMLIECEAYACNKANTAGAAGINLSSNCMAIYCNSHDNAGSNNDGFTTTAGANNANFYNCISDTNGRFGLSSAPGFITAVMSCDFYNNGSDGIRNSNTTSNSMMLIRNCNFIKNVGWGINTTVTTGRFFGQIDNCGFGSGTQINTSGTTNNTDTAVITGSVIYISGATPWVDPANGDFRINLAGAKGAGRGAFTETQASYAGTVGYPDIGSAQHYDTQKSFTFGG